jgi:hypothetical protein
MKTTLILGLFFVAVMFTACEREYSFETGTGSTGSGGTGGGGGGGTGGGGSTTTGTFTAKVEGAAFSANRFSVVARGSGLFLITGVADDGKVITLNLIDSGVHNYRLHWDIFAQNVGTYIDSAASITPFTSNFGTSVADGGGFVNITAIDEVNKKVSGTFGFVATNLLTNQTKKITDGVFTNIQLTIAAPNPGGADTVTAKVNGTPYSALVPVGYVQDNNIFVSGASGTNIIELDFPENITPGTYTLSNVASPFNAGYYTEDDDFLAEDTGTLVITSINPATKRVRGTFSFKGISGSSSVTVTDGFFSVTYD